jgi:solute carrier family 27 (fatty acid transporter), member 1/4
LSNKVGNFFTSKGFKKGDTVSLLMETRLEYSSMWLGLSKIGCVTALINTNLRKETLVHSIRVASSKAIIVGAELLDALAEIITDEEISKLDIFVYDTQSSDVRKLSASTVHLHRELQDASSKAIDISANLAKDKLFYIYTSGTTGMPKVSKVSCR